MSSCPKNIIDFHLLLLWLLRLFHLHRYHFPNKAKKLFRFPSLFGTFSRLLSSNWFADSIDIEPCGTDGFLLFLLDGRGLSVSSADSAPSSEAPCSRRGVSFGFSCVLRLARPLIAPCLDWLSTALSSLEFLLRFSISPSIVTPLVARYSSATPMKRTMPRSGGTPRDSPMKFWMSAAFRLFVVGCICEGRAVIVRIYAESKVPANRTQAEWARVMKIEEAGRWYRWERCSESSVRKTYSSLTCGGL